MYNERRNQVHRYRHWYRHSVPEDRDISLGEECKSWQIRIPKRESTS
jgi:hypothetical protein